MSESIERTIVMSKTKTIMKAAAVIFSAVLISGAAAACTPESPPLPPLTGESSETQSFSETSGESVQSRTVSISEKSEETVSSQGERSGIVAETDSSNSVLWDENIGEVATVRYMFLGEGGYTIEAQTTDWGLIKELTEAVRALRLSNETDVYICDSNETYTFWDVNGNSFSLSIAGGTVMKDNVRYDLDGLLDLKVVKDELIEKYSGENMEESYKPFTEQELADMETVGDRLKELTDSQEYNAASLAERRTMAVKLLNELSDEGLVIRESICAPDDNDLVSFRYSSDVLGGIMLKEWDPMIN